MLNVKDCPGLFLFSTSCSTSIFSTRFTLAYAVKCSRISSRERRYDGVTDRPTLCATFADMKRHDSCSCHNASSSPNTKAATQRIFIVEVTAFCHYAHLCNGAFMFFYYSKIQPAHRLSLPDYCLGRSQQPDLWLISPLVLLRTE